MLDGVEVRLIVVLHSEAALDIVREPLEIAAPRVQRLHPVTFRCAHVNVDLCPPIDGLEHHVHHLAVNGEIRDAVLHDPLGL